ncbi:MAG TPA: hypothetical protein VJP02_25190 [Candidatus Sulfotelmatobacter sp.]|nr:hypothetical protein [Candidatus Sulfotelmatobacter sp.]
MTGKERKAGKKERIQKLLKGLANIRPEPVKLDPSVVKTLELVIL